MISRPQIAHQIVDNRQHISAAFSPTDVMPLSRWAKGAMALQAGVSIVTVALVIARAVNILK